MTLLHGAVPLFAVCDCGTVFIDHNHLPLSYILSDGITGLNKNEKGSFAYEVPISTMKLVQLMNVNQYLVVNMSKWRHLTTKMLCLIIQIK